MIRVALFVLVFSAFAGKAAQPARAGDWNSDAIQWREYDEALVEAKQSGKPMCVVVYTNWCVHCGNYSRVFHTPAVVEASRQFVMVRLNEDFNSRLCQQFTLDGAYIPRTYFLRPDGTPMRSVHVPRTRYKYFYDEHDPASLLAGMRAARKLPR